CWAINSVAKVTPKISPRYLPRSPVSIFSAIQYTSAPPFGRRAASRERRTSRPPSTQAGRLVGSDTTGRIFSYNSGMKTDDTALIQGLLDRLRQGDRAARQQLLERACGRLRRLAGQMLHGLFPDLARRHEVDSVVHEAWFRLLQALDQTEPATVADFL